MDADPFQTACPTCRALPEETCVTRTGNDATRPHAARAHRAAQRARTPESPPEVREATESPTTGRLDPSSVVRPGDAPIYDALVAEMYAAARAERPVHPSAFRAPTPRRGWSTRGIGRARR